MFSSSGVGANESHQAGYCRVHQIVSIDSVLITRFEEKNSIDAIVEGRKLYRPCLIREMLKQKFSIDDKTVEEYINNPSTIPDLRYVSLVLCSFLLLTDRFRAVTGPACWKWLITTRFARHWDWNTNIF